MNVFFANKQTEKYVNNVNIHNAFFYLSILCSNILISTSDESINS